MHWDREKFTNVAWAAWSSKNWVKFFHSLSRISGKNLRPVERAISEEEVLFPFGKTCEESGHRLLLEPGWRNLVESWNIFMVNMVNLDERSNNIIAALFKPLLENAASPAKFQRMAFTSVQKYFELFSFFLFKIVWNTLNVHLFLKVRIIFYCNLFEICETFLTFIC